MQREESESRVMKSLDERTYTYVVKIWEERRDMAGAEPTWRGSVEDIQTGTRRYFDALHDLSSYLGRQTGMLNKSCAHDVRRLRGWL